MTLGLIKPTVDDMDTVPMTLLKGYELDYTKSITDYIMLKKNKGDIKFKNIIKGTSYELKSYIDMYPDLSDICDIGE